MKELTAQPYFGVMLTVAAYWLGMKVQKKTRLAICNGMLIAVLLVIAVLVAVLGIQIVRVYQQLKVARQEEAALSQQLTQQQQENDALRSDLEKKLREKGAGCCCTSARWTMPVRCR